MSLIIPLVQGAARRSYKVLTASPVAAVVADHDHSQLINILHKLNISNTHNNIPQSGVPNNTVRNRICRQYSAATAAGALHHHIPQTSPRTYSTISSGSDSGSGSDSNSTSTSTNINTSTSPSAFQNNLPRCSGITGKNKPCQRDGINAFTESSTAATITTNSDSNNNRDSNSTSDAVVRYYCYQHDPRLVVRRRCIGYVASEHRQCRITCSKSEIRSGGRPICNRHFRLGARLVTRRT